MKKIFASVALAWTLLAVAGCESILPYDRTDPECPVVLSISPTGARFGEVVTVNCENLYLDDIAEYQVLINGVALPEGSIEDVDTVAQTLSFLVPLGQQGGLLSIRLRNPANFCEPENSVSAPQFTYYYTATLSPFAGTAFTTSCPECFDSPRGLDVDPSGNLFVVDRLHHVIKMIPYNQSVPQKPTIIAGRTNLSGSTDDILGIYSTFNAPSDIALDESGNIYVADEFNYCIRKIDKNINRTVTTITGDPNEPGGTQAQTSLSEARYNLPIGIATNGTNKIFVTDYIGHRLRQIDIGANTVTTLVGDGTPSFSGLSFPVGVAFSLNRSAQYSIFVADRSNNRILGVGATTTSIGSPTYLSQPVDMAIDQNGAVFVVDQGKKQIIAIYPDNHYEVIAGEGTQYDAFEMPSGIAADAVHSILYVSDESKHTIAKITLE